MQMSLVSCSNGLLKYDSLSLYLSLSLSLSLAHAIIAPDKGQEATL